MKINKKSGILEGVDYIPSPNADDRPEEPGVELVVVHNISLPPKQFGGPYRDGRIIQFVPFHRRAWHAGESSYCGRERCNDFSIGIELEGSDDQPFEDVQYRQLADMISCLRETYPSIAKEAITGHCDIAPGRKTDPGPFFDWDRLKKLLNA